jgi:hypothetical protein
MITRQSGRDRSPTCGWQSQPYTVGPPGWHSEKIPPADDIHRTFSRRRDMSGDTQRHFHISLGVGSRGSARIFGLRPSARRRGGTDARPLDHAACWRGRRSPTPTVYERAAIKAGAGSAGRRSRPPIPTPGRSGRGRGPNDPQPASRQSSAARPRSTFHKDSTGRLQAPCLRVVSGRGPRQAQTRRRLCGLPPSKCPFRLMGLRAHSCDWT